MTNTHLMLLKCNLSVADCMRHLCLYQQPRMQATCYVESLFHIM